MLSAGREVRNTYCSQAMLFAILVAIAMIMADEKAMGKGLLLGTLFSIINFVAMAELLPLRMNKDRRQSVMAAFGSILLRFSLLSIPLWLAINYEMFNLFSTIAGLFMVQGAILFKHFFRQAPKTKDC